METNIPGIYAVGDVTGKIMLAHMASKEGVVAAKNIMGIDVVIDYNTVPAAIFTSPEIASVGIREHQAVEKGPPMLGEICVYKL
jgi:dihydrolipoamide dehydrogenase